MSNNRMLALVAILAGSLMVGACADDLAGPSDPIGNPDVAGLVDPIDHPNPENPENVTDTRDGRRGKKAGNTREEY